MGKSGLQLMGRAAYACAINEQRFTTLDADLYFGWRRLMGSLSVCVSESSRCEWAQYSRETDTRRDRSLAVAFTTSSSRSIGCT